MVSRLLVWLIPYKSPGPGRMDRGCTRFSVASGPDSSGLVVLLLLLLLFLLLLLLLLFALCYY